MKIVLLINTMGRGGAEMQVRDVALRLARRQHEVSVISLLPFEEFEEELRAGGVRTATLGMSKGKASGRALYGLVRLLRRIRADVVHAHMYSAIIAARLARMVMGMTRPFRMAVPALIGTSHATFEVSSLRYAAYRATDRFGDLWTCVSREGLEHHVEKGAVSRDRALVVPNGIDIEAFEADDALRHRVRAQFRLDDASFVWLSVGSFRDEAKDYGNLLRAFQRVCRTSSKARLLIAGEGILLDDKKLLARELGVAENVDFLGLRRDVDALMHAADAFVLASAWEAMPVVLLEAAASGLPAVTTDVGQTRDIVNDDTGIVVPPRDDAALAEAMSRLMGLDARCRRELGNAARNHVGRDFSLDRIVDVWEQQYERLAGRGTRQVA
ncbi:Glycosyltransferase [Labilithrix luteola]|uniref:Glycosyltransferase n=1 Tax=Labilithrix luteola TaxID=1391654 RepID=A0A0K1Q5Y8_9BACT|nr:Glycosyltransferase [Labilithrix luteola]